MSELQNVFASIASAIRAKNDKSEAFTPAQMINEINKLDKILYAENISDKSIISYYDNNSYTYIDGCAFYNCSSLNTVSFPEVTYIGANAFYSCPLTNFSFPKLKKIAPFGFYGTIFSCTSLHFDECEKIGDYAFSYCRLVSDYFSPITAPSVSSFYFSKCTEIGKQAFYATSGDTYNYILKTFSAPECKIVKEKAFMGLEQLSTIYLPKIEIIENSAFRNCTRASFNVGNFENVKYIGTDAFYNCKSLSGMVSLNNISNCSDIGSGAFGYTRINSFYIPCFDSSTASIPCNCFTNTSISGELLLNCKTIGEGAFQSCIELKAISSPVCESIGRAAFSACKYISSIYFPECTFVGPLAFTYCNLSSFYLPKLEDVNGFASISNITTLDEISFPACKTIGYMAFYNCSNLTKVSFTNCTSVGESAFNICGNLSEVYLSNCLYIESGCFSNCAKLSSIYTPKCLKVGYGAFYNCKSLTTISFSECLSIGNGAFSNCNNLVDISFPKCSFIGHYAFSSCTVLTIASFPECSTLGNSAFFNCTSLLTASFPNISSIGYSTFQNCTKLTTIYFPECKSIYNYAFQNCTALTMASFPKCGSIGYAVFSGCTSLLSVYFPECSYISNCAFQNCSKIITASFPKCSFIQASAFLSCKSLISLYLLSNKLVSLANSNAFNNSPLSAGGSGTIYIPSDLYSNYISANNWSLISARIASYIE